jgi:tRNA modification GTPase
MSDATPSCAILLTPRGAAAIAVVRIAGPRVLPFLVEHFSRAAKVGRCVHGELRDGERLLDDSVVVLHADGRTADLNVHGGPWVVTSVMDFLRREGFELLTPQDDALPAIAVDAPGAGASPLWRDVISHVPLARTEQALRLLLAQPVAWSRGDVPRVDDECLWWLLHPPWVAIIGAPNVGKSTLANQLFAQECSITADLPGTTRDWVGELANIDGLAVMLVDTPGLRETSDAIEREAIARSGAEVKRADLVVLVLDASALDTPEQRHLIHAYPDTLVVLNKSDRAAEPITDDGIRTVATTGEGVDDLRLVIRTHFGCATFDERVPRWWTREQREQLRVT